MAEQWGNGHCRMHATAARCARPERRVAQQHRRSRDEKDARAQICEVDITGKKDCDWEEFKVMMEQ